jgi:hypothetical protein
VLSLIPENKDLILIMYGGGIIKRFFIKNIILISLFLPALMSAQVS